jgi:hypothetical protein
VVHERFGLVRPVGPRRDRRPRAPLGNVELVREGFEQRTAAVAVGKLAQPAFAQPRDADLSAQIAEDELGGAAVRG